MHEENEIIADICRGIDKYELLVRRYHVGLIIHCENIVHNRADAEDIAQEAFVKAYINLSSFDSKKARFSTWLYKIATNQCIDFIRQNNKNVDVEDIESIAEATMPSYMEDEERRLVRSAVEKLTPAEYRSVIEQYYWQGKSYQEIAAKQGVPLNTVRTWLRRAKQQLQEDLA